MVKAAEMIDAEEVTVAGTLAEVDGRLVLNVDGETYSIGGPGTMLYADNFEEGDVIEIEGLLTTGCEDDCDSGLDGHIMAEKVSMDGEEYVFVPGGSGRRGTRNSTGRRFDGNRPGGNGQSQNRNYL